MRPVIAAISVLLTATAVAQPQPPGAAVFPHGAVAADHYTASQAGIEVLKAGGNAVDAAVATSFALSVVRPLSCGIGGGGFMLVHLKDDPRHGTIDAAINYREECPGAYGPDYYSAIADPDASTHGGRSVAVPGTVAGLLYALDKYGSMTRAQVLAPAIRAAEEGFLADTYYVESSKEVIDWLNKSPDRPARFAFFYERFLKRGGVAVGDRIKVPEQAAVFRLIAEHGADGFYKGPVADAILRAVTGDGGGMTAQDLAGFTVRDTPPLTADFLGRTLLMMPPPSSGGIAVTQALELLELRRDAVAKMEHNSAPYIHLVAESMKHAFADRARWLGDPAFVDIPIRKLLSPDYLKARSDLFDPGRTLASDAYGTSPPLPGDHGTSHLSVVDSRGNAVACTETINLIFGSLLPVPEFGFVLNDEMDDFLTRRGVKNAFGLEQSERNLPAPGKRPLSSMSPIIGLDKDGVVLVAGGSGGPRIISGTLEVALNVLVFDLPAGEAVVRPRFHHQWQPDVLQLEDGLKDSQAEKSLNQLGHRTELRNMLGAVQLVRRNRSGPGFEAASDPRKGGAPAGY